MRRSMPLHGWTNAANVERPSRLDGRCAIRMFSAVVMEVLVMPWVKD
jgi:hypothetical protein